MKGGFGDAWHTGKIGQMVLKVSQWRMSTVWFTVFCGGAILYTLTSQTTVSWQDSGVYQWRILVADYSSLEGLAVAHPFLILLGQAAKMLPVGDVLWRLNAINGIGMAVALANLMALITLLNSRRWIGVIIAALIGVSHAVWWVATITETYGWVIAGLTAELILFVHLVRRPKWSTLGLLAFLNGAGLCLHDFALLPLPVYFVTAILLVRRKLIPLWSLGVALFAYLAGAGVYIGMTVHLAISTHDIVYAIESALFAGGYDAVSNVSLITEYTKANAALGALSFANVLLPLAVLGWFRFKPLLGGTLAWSLGWITFIEVLFFIRYSSADQFTFLPPSMVMVAIAAAVGANYLASLSEMWKRSVAITCMLSIVFMPILYGTLPGILRQAGVEVNRSRMLPFRDEIRYWITPWKQNEESAQRFAEAALTQALPDGVVLSDMTPLYPLMVTRALQPNFGGVSLQLWGKPLPRYNDNRIAFDKVLGGRSLYIVSPQQGYLDEGFIDILRDADCVRKDGEVLYRVVWKNRQGF